MPAQFYAVRMEADQIVAAEIGDRAAAELLDAGHSVVLATELELHRLVRLHQKQRIIFFRAARPATSSRGGMVPVSASPVRAEAQPLARVA